MQNSKKNKGNIMLSTPLQDISPIKFNLKFNSQDNCGKSLRLSCKRKNVFLESQPSKKKKIEGPILLPLFNHLHAQDASKSTFQTKKTMINIRIISISEIADRFKKIQQQSLSDKENIQKFECPRAPKKSCPGRTLNAHGQLFKDAEKGSLLIYGFKYNLTRFGEGTFMKVYKLQGQSKIQNEVSNDKLLLKLYSRAHISFDEKTLSCYMNNSIENYNAAKKLDLPVSTIYNIQTAITDKFFLVELIPNEADLGNENQLKQIQSLFKVSFEKKLLLDLSFSNLRVRENGTVTLIDFVEEPVKFTDACQLSIFVIQYLKSWTKEVQQMTLNADFPQEQKKELAAQLLTILTEGLEPYGFDPACNQTAVEASFK